MATFLNDVVSGWWYYQTNYVHATLTGDVSRSGDTVTLSNMWLALRAEQNSSGSEGQWFDVNGTRTNYTVTANGTDLGGRSLNNTSFSVSTTQTSANVSWASSDGYSGQFQVSFPSGATPPTSLDISNVRPGVESFTATVSLSGWGVGSGNRYRELQCWTNGLVEPRRYQSATGDALSSDIVVSNSSQGTLTIVGNTEYTLGSFATNGSANTGSLNEGNYTTLAYPPSVSISSISANSAVLSYSIRADGGKYNKDLQYSVDGGTNWVTVSTLTSGAAVNGNFTLSNLATNSVTEVETRVVTTVGASVGNSVTIDTAQRPKFYGSVNNEAGLTVKFYGSDNGQAAPIIKVYASDNGLAKRIY